MSSGTETTVYLVKDFPIPSQLPANVGVAGQWIWINAENVSLNERDIREVNLVGIGTFRDFFQNLKSLPNSRSWSTKGVLALRATIVRHDIRFSAFLSENLRKNLENLYTNLDSFGPRISLIIRISTAQEGVPTVEKRFKLNELPHRLAGQAILTLTGTKSIENATCDIVFGWTEETRDAVNPHSAKRIKMDVSSFIKNVFENEPTKDLTVVAGDGVEMKCHSNIFTAHSSALAAMLSPKSRMKESQTGRVIMNANSGEGVNLLIRFLYGLELMTNNLSCEVALELFRTADMYELSHLRNSVGDLLLEKDGDWFTPDGALGVYFYVRNLKDAQKLEEHALSIMSGMDVNKLKRCEAFQKLDPGEATDLVCKLVETLQRDKSVKVTKTKLK